MIEPADLLYLESLEECPEWFQGTGALPLQPDPRDRQTRHDPTVQAIVTAPPATASLMEYVTGPSYNQGSTGACVAASTSGACSLNTQHFQGAWHVFDWLQLYHEAGGIQSNGVDSRLVLQICTNKGTPLAAGGREFVIESYDFITQQPGAFRDEAKACIALGFPVVVALLLPSDFGWMSGQPSAAVTQGYHQVKGLAYDPDYLIIRNSWGDSWPGTAGSPKPGVGSIRWDYLEASNMQNRYCYAYRMTAKGGIVPPPPPVVVVSGYQPNPVGSGASFSIQGSAFDQGSLRVTWQGITLPVLGVNPDVIATKAPAVSLTSTAPVHVQVGDGAADGPPLTVQADVIPPPPATRTIVGIASGGNLPLLTVGPGYHVVGNGTAWDLEITKIDGGPPPPPGQITVSGYSGYTPPLLPGQDFTILGSGFSATGSLTVTWGGQTLMATRVSDTVIQATAPVGAKGTNPVIVQIGTVAATGPLLLIGDGGPPPVQGIKVMVSTKPSQFRNTVTVFAYTADQNGVGLAASVNGSITGPQGTTQLWGQTTHGTAGPAVWQVARPAPWGTPCDVVVNAFTGGLTGTGTAKG